MTGSRGNGGELAFESLFAAFSCMVVQALRCVNVVIVSDRSS